MSTPTVPPQKVWTEAELQSLPEDGFIHEVVNTRREIDDRLKDFFSSGTRLAWVIDPEEQRVEICHSPTRRQLVGSGGLLDGEDLLPGFTYPIADLFKEWDWD